MNRVIPATPAQDAGPADHLCRHPACSHWGSWGYDAGEGISDWWCLEHRPDQDPVKPLVQDAWVSDGNEG